VLQAAPVANDVKEFFKTFLTAGTPSVDTPTGN
jgi:hypothetical protein